MNNKFLLSISLFITNCAAYAQTPQDISQQTIKTPVILHSIPAPAHGVNDIAYDGENLWLTMFGAYQLYKLSPLDGAVLKTIPTSIYYPIGLEFIDGKLYVVDKDFRQIQVVDTLDGTVISSFATPCNYSTSTPSGLAWDGQSMWLNDAMNTYANDFDSTFRLSQSGQLQQRYKGYGRYATGLAWDGTYLWSSDNDADVLFKIQTGTFTVIDTVSAPGGSYPNGLAFDGQHLWVANNDSDSLFQIDISGTNVELSENKIAEIKLYPNPANDELWLEIPALTGSQNYEIIDLSGRKVLTGKFLGAKNRISISSLNSGTYLLKTGISGENSLRFVKQ